MIRHSNKRRFLVMPGRGISGPAMEAGIFQDKVASSLTQLFGSQLMNFESAASTTSLMATRTARAEISEAIEDPDFAVLSQRFDDGPAVVSMTNAARLALEASNPDLRVLPITRYYLPGQRPIRGKSAAARIASRVAAESAADAQAVVFLNDLKQHFLGGPAPAGSDGAGVLVGIIDTGIDGTHPALQGRIAASRCLIPGDTPTAGGPVDWGVTRRDRAGHGTHVAGIVAAAPEFGGPAGVAPGARLISYRIFPNSPSGVTPAENPVIIDSIRAAIDDGCHVINLSIEGATLKEDGVRSAIVDAWSNGVLCIAAAGNGYGNPVSYPAALQHCVAVTAIGRDGDFPNTPSFTQYVSDQRSRLDPAVFLASFSNFGPQVQFTAPGHAVVSTFPGGEWWFNSGTSMAAPYITGMLARFLSANGNIRNMAGNEQRSAAMLQMLIARAHMLQLPQASQEGYGLPN
ncbi:MAG: Subtilase family protein [Bradyrhizobium sp.]|nr:Subtilase family protein [Bradyrhizobium sp.]